MSAVVLREFTAADEPALTALFEDALTRQWNAGPTSDAVTQWWTDNNIVTPTVATWAVADPGDDRLLGTVCLLDIDPARGTAEVGYRVVPAERGRGVGTEALKSAAAYGFTTLGLTRIQLYHAVANPASCRVAIRAGFAHEQTVEDSYVYGDGISYDEHLHARTKP